MPELSLLQGTAWCHDLRLFYAQKVIPRKDTNLFQRTQSCISPANICAEASRFSERLVSFAQLLLFPVWPLAVPLLSGAVLSYRVWDISLDWQALKNAPICVDEKKAFKPHKSMRLQIYLGF